MKLKRVVLFSLLSFAILILAVWFMPVAFTACKTDSYWCLFAYWITESAGKYGTILIIVLTGIFYSVRFETWKLKGFNFLKATIALFVFLGTFAWINEHITKKATRVPRPSHSFIFEQANPQINIDSMYFLDESERHQLLKQMIESNREKFLSFDKKVIEHWIEEAGYSFPSGHSFNAFLLGNIMAFSLLNSRRNFARYIWFLPLMWAPVVALSRVAIGAHSALDVSFGAGMGILISGLFLYFDNARRLIIHKKQVS